jgi:hypothetical protein
MRNLKFNLEVEPNALLCPNPQEFYSKTYVSEDIVNNFRTLPGIKSATKLANVLFDDLLKASNCSFSASDTTLDAIDIDVCALSAMTELCQFDLEQSFLSLQMAKGSNGNYQVSSFMSFFWDEMAKEIHEEISVLRWKGVKTTPVVTYLDLCDGYEGKFLADTDVVAVEGIAITTSNVIAEMIKVVEALPAQLKNKKADLRFYVASNVALAYELAAAQGNTISFITQSLGLSFLGIKVVPQEGMSDNTMVLTLKDNMIYAFDGEGDGKALKAVDMDATAAEPQIRTRANLKVGFHYVNPTEIVFYSPLVS